MKTCGCPAPKSIRPFCPDLTGRGGRLFPRSATRPASRPASKMARRPTAHARLALTRPLPKVSLGSTLASALGGHHRQPIAGRKPRWPRLAGVRDPATAVDSSCGCAAGSGFGAGRHAGGAAAGPRGPGPHPVTFPGFGRCEADGADASGAASAAVGEAPPLRW